MSKATFTFGRFNPPTEVGHGKLVSAVQDHAEKNSARHYIFPSHSQDAKKNPLSHGDKVGAMNRLFPNANIVSSGKVRTAIDAMKHLEKQGHTDVTMVVGSDRVAEFHGLLSKYRKKEFPGIKKVNVISAGNRDPDAEGAEGMSASKLRGLVAAGKKKEFVSHYSDPKLGAHIHDKVKAAMQTESTTPIGIFLLGGPGSGKDYVLKNIFSRFDLTEVQVEHLLSGAANELIESSKNIVINGSLDEEKIAQVKGLLEGYNFDCVYVSVTNKVSRLRNSLRENPIAENKRLEKWYRVDKFAESLEEKFTFNNSLNLNESSEFEKVFFADQIQKLLERLIENGLVMKEESEPKSFTVLREKKFPPVRKKYGMPEKYVRGLSKSTAMARKRHWQKAGELSDKDPEAYKPAPGDKTAETKPSRHTLVVRRMMDEGADSSLTAKAEKSGISVATLRKVYKRGVAAWNSGHRPGTTPQQWGHARVNSYINKGKTYHTADKDLREEADINDLFEMQLVGTDEYRKHAIAMTPGQSQEIQNAFPVDNSNKKSVVKKENEKNPTNEHTNCGTPDCCGECSGEVSTGSGKSFRELRSEAKEETSGVDFTPVLTKRKSMKGLKAPAKAYNSTMDGLPVTTRLGGVTEAKSDKGFMPTPRQVPAPKGGHPVPAGYERVKSWGGAWELRKIKEKPTTVKEAVEYHIENKISFTENIFRPGSDMFFEMIGEAKKLYKEGKYAPEDEYEKDLLESNIGEKAIFEGKEVMLDFPFEEELNEADDPTDGKGIGKPFRQGSGAAVYVRTGDGGIRKVNFSQSGMKKRYNEPARVRSFVARHKCLTNKDKTSASYWACRWPRYFSNSGQLWW